MEKIRSAIVSARAALITASHDRPEDLERPARARVIASKIEELTQALAELEKLGEALAPRRIHP
jgi:hypothetical protein